MADSNAPIVVIKRKKVVGGDGHHGGAWKVAYADFVTAMMAFFLLMWLLNATTESQRKGIADYFAPTVPISPISGGGNGILNGDEVFSQETLAKNGEGGETASTKSDDRSEPAPGSNAAEDEGIEQGLAEAFEALEAELRGMSGESETADDLLSHIVTRVTDEGLVIDVFAKEGRPLFETGSELPTEKMLQILDMIAEVASHVSNGIAIDGHTDAAPFSEGARDNWGLSAGRANASRLALIGSGLTDDRFQRVTGKAARELALPDQPLDPRNRRITLTLLRSDLRMISRNR
ncbi:MAG: flagellar motor protein MotB [Pseudomonadota bacterium]